MTDETRALITQPTTAIEPATPEPETVHLVASNSEQMAAAQADLATWLQHKVAACTQDVEQLHGAVQEALEHRWKADTLKNQHSRALQRQLFYGKCLAAVQQGYTIIPNIPIDLFAIRVKRNTPVAPVAMTRSESQFPHPHVDDEKPQILPVGEGRYASPQQRVQDTARTETGDKGEKIIVREQWPTAFDAIEFPIIAAIPAVMNATQQAMAARIFDQIGISPQRQVRRGDPLIIGQVLGPRNGYGARKTLSFLIAWHLDLRTL